MPNVVVMARVSWDSGAAYQALLNGSDVDILEASAEPGGMAAHFDFGGISIERFYHFVCKTDHPTFELLTDLGIADKMRWVPTTMGFFSQGKLHPGDNSDFFVEASRRQFDQQAAIWILCVCLHSSRSLARIRKSIG